MRGSIRSIAVVFGAALALSFGSAGAAAPYGGTYTDNAPNADLLGRGTATASSTQNVSGALSVSSTATSNSPTGTWVEMGGRFMIGASESRARSGVVQAVDVLAGELITVTINGISASADAQAAPLPYSYAIAGVLAEAEFFMYDTCAIGANGCYPNEAASGAAQSVLVQAGNSGAVPASVTLTYTVPSNGQVLVRTGLRSTTFAQGQAGNATASGSATVADIVAE